MYEDGPSEDDLNRFGSDTGHCPHCGEEIWDQADFCPSCGDAITHTLSRTPGRQAMRKVFFGVVGVIALAAFVLVVLT